MRISRILPIVLLMFCPLIALSDGFLDDVLNYGFEAGSTTLVYVSGLRDNSATHIAIPSTVVYEYTDYNDKKDDNGNYKIKHRTCTVNSIGGNAFDSCRNLTSITIPDSATIIGDFAFRGCSGLTSVTIPNGVTIIGGKAFLHCSGLTSVTIGNSVTSIGWGAFGNCNGLTSVTIPDSTTYVGGEAFEYCSSLTNITIGNGVTCILRDTFECCSNLTSVKIGKSVTSIGNCAFWMCSELMDVTIPNSVTDIEQNAFTLCSGLTSITIPDSVTSIGGAAFGSCGSLTNVTISSSITSIKEGTFAGCSFTDITIPSSVTNIGERAFYLCRNAFTFSFLGVPPSVGSMAFDDVKPGAVGTYVAAHKAEWESVIDENGYWNGLKMQVAEPPPPLTLAAESADWSSGSIMLCCDGTDSKHMYTLQYYDENSAKWVDVTGTDATVSLDANGNAHLTDKGFSSRLGGIPPVNYRVKEANSDRVSEPCVTRKRYGIFVGVGHYSEEYQKKCMWYGGGEPLDDLPEVEGNTRRYAELSCDNGAFTFIVSPLIGTSATTENVDAAFVTTAETVSPGDVCLFYVATHGGVLSKDNGGLKKGTAVLALYDDDYSEFRLKDGIDLLSARNSAVICILSACRSEALVRQSMANVAVIAAANYQGFSTELFDEIFMEYGWRNGWARDDDALTFGDLATYVKARYNAIFSGITFDDDGELTTRSVQVDNDNLLSKVVAGTCGFHDDSKEEPSQPEGFNATKAEFGDLVNVTWRANPDADLYFVFYGRNSGGVYEGFECLGKGDSSYTFNSTKYKCVELSSANSPVFFEIRAFNGAGVSLATVADGWAAGKWIIVFWAGNGKMVGDWMGMPVQRNMAGFEYFEKVMQRHETLRLSSLPQATRDGYTCTGWIKENQGTCTKASVDMVLSKESYEMRFVATWTAMTTDYLNQHPPIATASGGDIVTAANMTAANGCRTVGECYALGIDPEDPNDDLKITDFKMEDGKPVITLNHTEDGSGNSFMPRVKTLGKATLSDEEEWREVPEEGDETMRFFKVDVEMP